MGMARLRSTIAVLATLALAGAALPIEATASGSAQHLSSAAPQRTVLLHKRVRSAGVYVVRVAITTRSSGGGVVDLKIGKLSRRATTRGRRPHARVRVEVAIRGRMLTISATTKLGTPNVDVQVRRLRSLRPHTNGTPAAMLAPGANTRASGPHSPTGVSSTPAAGPTGTTGTTESAVVSAPTGVAGPPGDPGSWHSIFADEFSGSTLDSSKWSTGWLSSGITAPVGSAELQCYDPAQVVVGSGELDLNLIAQPETCGGVNRPYASGMVNTNGKFSYTYGYLEARVWVSGSGAISNWPAVWTDGQSWPTDGELDVMEGLSGQACWHFHDPQGGPGGCSSATFTGGWHTFGADWEQGTVTYYYDGINVGTINTGITSSPMYVILNLAADTSNSGPLQAPATMRTDYVRVWQH